MRASLEERVASLERRVRWWQIATVLAGAWALAAPFPGGVPS